jgi:hypothetical protein
MIPPSQLPKPPLGVLSALRAGFTAVNNRLELALFPLLLDLFLWLGPKLSLKPLAESTSQALGQASASMTAALQQQLEYSAATQMAQFFDQWRLMVNAVGDAVNMFATLRTAPLGVPALITTMPDSLPAGIPQPVWMVSDPLLALALAVSLSLAGFFLGAVYFNCIAQQIRAQRVDLGLLLKQVWGDWVRLVLFAVLIPLAASLVLVPLLVVGVLVALVSPPLGAFLMLGGAVTVIMWGVLYLGFTLPGIILLRRGLFGAMWDSARVVRWSVPGTIALYTVLYLISAALNLVWNLVSPNSWVTLAALAGHALVATALVAACFVFYQDRLRWWQEMRSALAAQVAKAQPPARRTV